MLQYFINIDMIIKYLIGNYYLRTIFRLFRQNFRIFICKTKYECHYKKHSIFFIVPTCQNYYIWKSGIVEGYNRSPRYWLKRTICLSSTTCLSLLLLPRECWKMGQYMFGLDPAIFVFVWNFNVVAAGTWLYGRGRSRVVEDQEGGGNTTGCKPAAITFDFEINCAP